MTLVFTISTKSSFKRLYRLFTEAYTSVDTIDRNGGARTYVL